MEALRAKGHTVLAPVRGAERSLFGRGQIVQVVHSTALMVASDAPQRPPLFHLRPPLAAGAMPCYPMLSYAIICHAMLCRCAARRAAAASCGRARTHAATARPWGGSAAALGYVTQPGPAAFHLTGRWLSFGVHLRCGPNLRKLR
jgi:hypothetical protein